jgi:hypothetical protein
MINETMFHPEWATFRAVTGGAYNFPNSYGDIMSGSSFPVKGTIPVSLTYPGTFKTTGKNVRGVGTDFTKFIIGSFLYDGNVLRQIAYITSANFMTLTEGFPTDVSIATNVRICERQFFKMIIAMNTHATVAATLQEAPFLPNDRVVNGGAPYSYDATGSQISFQASQ